MKNNILLIIILLNTFNLCSQIRIDSRTETIILNRMPKKSVPIELCFFNESNSAIKVDVNKLIYNQDGILKTIIEDSSMRKFSILKFKLTDTLYNKLFFSSIPGYTAINELITYNQIKTKRVLLPINRKACSKFFLDLSNIQYKVSSKTNYFITVYMLHNNDTIFLNTPLILRIKS